MHRPPRNCRCCKAQPPQLAAKSGSAWISEALQDLYGYEVGDRLVLPLAGRMQPFTVAGVWRDYARLSGSVVISRSGLCGGHRRSERQRRLHLA